MEFRFTSINVRSFAITIKSIKVHTINSSHYNHNYPSQKNRTKSNSKSKSKPKHNHKYNKQVIEPPTQPSIGPSGPPASYQPSGLAATSTTATSAEHPVIQLGDVGPALRPGYSNTLTLVFRESCCLPAARRSTPSPT